MHPRPVNGLSQCMSFPGRLACSDEVADVHQRSGVAGEVYPSL